MFKAVRWRLLDFDGPSVPSRSPMPLPRRFVCVGCCACGLCVCVCIGANAVMRARPCSPVNPRNKASSVERFLICVYIMVYMSIAARPLDRRYYLLKYFGFHFGPVAGIFHQLVDFDFGHPAKLGFGFASIP